MSVVITLENLDGTKPIVHSGRSKSEKRTSLFIGFCDQCKCPLGLMDIVEGSAICPSCANVMKDIKIPEMTPEQLAKYSGAQEPDEEPVEKDTPIVTLDQLI